MSASSRSLALSFALVFAGGALVGVLGHRFYSQSVLRADNPPPPNPETWRKNFIADLTKRLTLTPDQVKQLETILDETRVRFQSFRENSHHEEEAIRQAQTERIRAMLTPDQATEYEKFRKEREERRRQFMEKRKAAQKQ